MPQKLRRIRERLHDTLASRFWLRAHMTAILGLVTAAGVVVNLALLELGVTRMAWRYPLAVMASYGVFFVLVWGWLGYVAWAAEVDDGKSGIGEGLSHAADGLDVALNVGEVTNLGHSGSAGDGTGWLVGAVDEGVLFVLAGLALLGFVVGGIFLVWQAPLIASEAVFQMVLATVLLRAGRAAEGPGWGAAVFRRTWIPFAVMTVLVAILALGLGAAAPEATRLAEAIAMMRAN